jgi:tetratricopeptide (TPR) repeat protein
MTLQRIFFSLLFAGLFALPVSVSAQPPEPEDIAAVTDDFQDAFYESLKQKGIENYDLAIKSLEKCLALQPNNPVIYLEIGKNSLARKDYKRAYDSFEKASQLDPKNMWSFVGMYDVCYETRDFNKAIDIVQKLIEFKPAYKEDLVSLYMNTMQYDKALDLINELNETAGKSDMRENYKAQILADAKYQGPEKANLLEAIRRNPKDESNYIQLIYLYSESNEEEKALDIAKKLEREIPDSDWAQVSLFKFHLSSGDGDKAAAAMNRVFQSSKIDNKIKHRVMNEFLIFAKDKPQYGAQLEKAISYFGTDGQVSVAAEVGKFYHNKQMFEQSARYYEMHLKNNPDDIGTTVLLLETYRETGNFSAMKKKSESMIELFPLQPQFYYFAGLADNQQKDFKKAKEQLETGLEYLVDDVPLEINFYLQLAEAYGGLGDAKKKETYFAKADGLIKKQKK